jgi:hypothetical protein
MQAGKADKPPPTHATGDTADCTAVCTQQQGMCCGSERDKASAIRSESALFSTLTTTSGLTQRHHTWIVCVDALRQICRLPLCTSATTCVFDR